MHIRVWDDIGLVLTRAASFVYVIRWKTLMATWTPNQSYLETASVFGTKNQKEWRKCRDTVLKREDRQNLSFHRWTRIQNPEFWMGIFIFLFGQIILSRYITLIFPLSIRVCAFGAYISIPVCIHETFHALWLAVMSEKIILCYQYCLLFHLVLLSLVDSFIAV